MRIISNGSKWMGQEPDSVEKLIEVLGTHTLDPTFEDYGNFFHGPEYIDKSKQPPPGTFCAFGNFFDCSHVFNIEGTAEEMEPLRVAIEANKATPAYREAKQEIAERKLRERQEREASHARRQEEELERARAIIARHDEAGREAA